MDMQRPLWRTAWYWKQICLYYLGPLLVLDGVCEALLRAGHQHPSPHQFRIISLVVGSIGVAAFSLRLNHEAKKRAHNHL